MFHKSRAIAMVTEDYPCGMDVLLWISQNLWMVQTTITIRKRVETEKSYDPRNCLTLLCFGGPWNSCPRHCVELPCLPQSEVAWHIAIISEASDIGCMVYHLDCVLCSHLESSFWSDKGYPGLAWERLGEFLSICCSSGCIFSAKHSWWSFLPVPHAEAVDWELKLENCAILDVVVPGLFSVLLYFFILYWLDSCLMYWEMTYLIS
jgi:hypothetical protein